jgi:hypothetical protein
MFACNQRYGNGREISIHPAGCGCGCDDSACEYSRVRESYELVLLDDVPESHKKAEAADKEWKTMVSAYITGGKAGKLPIPPCPPCSDDCCVVLAKIKLPEKQSDPITEIVDIRRPCLSANDLMLALLAS